MERYSPYQDKLNIDIVTIEEDQGGTRKVINSYNSDIVFEVKPTNHTLGQVHVLVGHRRGVRYDGRRE